MTGTPAESRPPPANSLANRPAQRERSRHWAGSLASGARDTGCTAGRPPWTRQQPAGHPDRARVTWRTAAEPSPLLSKQRGRPLWRGCSPHSITLGIGDLTAETPFQRMLSFAEDTGAAHTQRTGQQAARCGGEMRPATQRPEAEGRGTRSRPCADVHSGDPSLALQGPSLMKLHTRCYDKGSYWPQ